MIGVSSTAGALVPLRTRLGVEYVRVEMLKVVVGTVVRLGRQHHNTHYKLEQVSISYSRWS
jgi:hypothetical protein